MHLPYLGEGTLLFLGHLLFRAHQQTDGSARSRSLWLSREVLDSFFRELTQVSHQPRYLLALTRIAHLHNLSMQQGCIVASLLPPLTHIGFVGTKHVGLCPIRSCLWICLGASKFL